MFTCLQKLLGDFPDSAVVKTPCFQWGGGCIGSTLGWGAKSPHAGWLTKKKAIREAWDHGTLPSSAVLKMGMESAPRLFFSTLALCGERQRSVLSGSSLEMLRQWLLNVGYEPCAGTQGHVGRWRGLFQWFTDPGQNTWLGSSSVQTASVSTKNRLDCMIFFLGELKQGVGICSSGGCHQLPPIDSSTGSVWEFFFLCHPTKFWACDSFCFLPASCVRHGKSFLMVVLTFITLITVVNNPPAIQETQETRVLSLGREDPLEKETATHSSILAWEIPWTEEPGGLQSKGSQRVGHDWAPSEAVKWRIFSHAYGASSFLLFSLYWPFAYRVVFFLLVGIDLQVFFIPVLSLLNMCILGNFQLPVKCLSF